MKYLYTFIILKVILILILLLLLLLLLLIIIIIIIIIIILYYRSDDKVPRQSPIDLQRQNFRTFFPLNFTKENRFFHVGIFNGLRKKFWLIVAPLPQCVRRLQNKTNLENMYTITDCC